MKIAIEGCCHGALDNIYAHIQSLEQRNNYKVDLLLICGDFQAIRNHRDLQCMAVPDKYKELGQFHKYYTGTAVAPCLTIVIGGNHEASNYLWELYHGGWLAPNIYYLGAAGCVQVNGIRIAGASGIFKHHDFRRGYYETMPYRQNTMRSAYHIREYVVRKLSLLTYPQIFLSHDWPQSIEHHGDLNGLLRRKQHFRADVQSGQLGSPPLMGLLQTLQPEWWFSAHLHVRFEATFLHGPPEPPTNAGGLNPDEIAIDDEDDEEVEPSKTENSAVPSSSNPDEISLDDEEEDVIAAPPAPPPPFRTKTNFLALDKCLPRRQFLEIIDVETLAQNEEAPTFSFDPEWLAISRAFHSYLSLDENQTAFPDEATARALVKQELEWVHEHQFNDTKIEDYQKFAMTAPGPGPEDSGKNKTSQPPAYCNPQTEAFCEMLQLENKINAQYRTRP